MVELGLEHRHARGEAHQAMNPGQALAMIAQMAADQPGNHGLQVAVAALQLRLTAPPLGVYTSFIGHGTIFPGMDLVSTNDGSGRST
jgi:hypothetical protein